MFLRAMGLRKHLIGAGIMSSEVCSGYHHRAVKVADLLQQYFKQRGLMIYVDFEDLCGHFSFVLSVGVASSEVLIPFDAFDKNKMGSICVEIVRKSEVVHLIENGE